MAVLRQEEFDAVRNGQTYASISDPLLLPMLSNDPLCVDHLESVFLAIDCSLELAAEIAKLKNLKEISFYGGSSAGHILANAKHLPVESVGFDTVIIDEQLLRTIAELPHLKEVHLAWKPNAKDAELFDTLLPEVRLVTP